MNVFLDAIKKGLIVVAVSFIPFLLFVFIYIYFGFGCGMSYGGCPGLFLPIVLFIAALGYIFVVCFISKKILSTVPILFIFLMSLFLPALFILWSVVGSMQAQQQSAKETQAREDHAQQIRSKLPTLVHFSQPTFSIDKEVPKYPSAFYLQMDTPFDTQMDLIAQEVPVFLTAEFDGEVYNASYGPPFNCFIQHRGYQYNYVVGFGIGSGKEKVVLRPGHYVLRGIFQFDCETDLMALSLAALPRQNFSIYTADNAGFKDQKLASFKVNKLGTARVEFGKETN